MKVVSVVGARPQFVKASPVSREIRKVATEVLLHTGQHYDPAMSAVFFDELGIPPPDRNLEVGSGSHGEQTARMLERIEPVLVDEQPDWVLVYGDTNSTLAGGLAAAKLHLPVAHVEAGLRSFNRRMPEEINRVLVDHLSAALFCPTGTAIDNLRAEGVVDGVHLVGDVMVDSVEAMRPFLDPEAGRRAGIEGDYLVATLHRAETVDDPDRLRQALRLLGAMPLPVVFPVHPRTAAALRRWSVGLPAGVVGTEPVGYLDMLSLVAGAELVLTDSGGLQKESVLLGTPCITMRPETEWVETVEAEMNRVVDLDTDRALEAFEALRGVDADLTEVFPPGASARIARLLADSKA